MGGVGLHQEIYRNSSKLPVQIRDEKGIRSISEHTEHTEPPYHTMFDPLHRL